MIWIGIIAACAAGWLIYLWWIARISLRWPVAEAKLDGGSVSASRRRGLSGGRFYIVQVRYSYFVAGSLYGGTWFKYFGSQAEADHLLKSLSELLVLVRYDPKSPARSYFDPYRDIRVEQQSSGRQP